ncbi:MAG: ABC transporter permease subunit [Dehalococcoidia bacterium]
MNAAPSRRAAPPPSPPFGGFSVLKASVLLAFALILASWFFILVLDRQSQHSFFSMVTLDRGVNFLRQLTGAGVDRTPAYLDGQAWLDTGKLAFQTLAMSVLAIGIAVIGALLTFMFGARNVMMGELSPYSGPVWKAWFFLVRAFFVITRAIPELVWAMLIVFVFTPGILPGALALGVHNLGILGKLASEIVEGLDSKPAHALRATGAGRLKVLVYYVLPQALPRFMTYSFYRWEVIIRTTIIVGFVAAGGLGMEFRLAMSHFHYTTVTLLLIWYLILVVSVDLIASGMRRLAR